MKVKRYIKDRYTFCTNYPLSGVYGPNTLEFDILYEIYNKILKKNECIEIIYTTLKEIIIGTNKGYITINNL